MFVSSLRILVLVDDRAGPGLPPEHGLSLWIEADGRRVLFDAGQGPALARHAEALGVDLSRADDVVLSHGHYDHGGGLPHALAAAPRARLLLGPGALTRRWSVRDGIARDVGLPDVARAAVAAHAAVVEVDAPLEVAPGVLLTGPIPRASGFEDVGGPFALDPAGRAPDPLADEVALAVRTRAGLVVVLGCGHAGVVSTLLAARRAAGEERVAAVLGGMHLGAASPERLDRTAEALRALDVGRVLAGHCTGERATAHLAAAPGPRVEAYGAGAAWTLA